jgi:putative hydrolase of the HAD superfamily
VAIAAVVFDFGGVLTTPPFAGLDRYAAELGLPAGTFTAYFRGDPEMARLERGEIASRDFFKYVCIDAEASHATRIDLHRLAGAAAVDVVPEMLDLVRDLRHGYRTAMLTNNVREATWRSTFPSDLFDVIVDSSAAGVRKPEPAIYQLLLDQLGCRGDKVVYFDDFEENLAPAAALGFITVHFTDPADCRTVLTELGLLAPVLSR